MDIHERSKSISVQMDAMHREMEEMKQMLENFLITNGIPLPEKETKRPALRLVSSRPFWKSGAEMPQPCNTN
jgi:hypothetical protein